MLYVLIALVRRPRAGGGKEDDRDHAGDHGGGKAEHRSNPFQAWPIVRGIWKLRTLDFEIIAALRLGHVLGVYRVDQWAHHAETGRKYAVSAAVITASGRLLDAAHGTDPGRRQSQTSLCSMSL